VITPQEFRACVASSEGPDPHPGFDAAAPVASSSGNWQAQWHDGDRFPGGYDDVTELYTDYWALRAKSAELFEVNLYARRAVRALVHAIINTGLFPESQPVEKVLGLPEGSLDEWADDIEERWQLWANDPEMCDYRRENTYGQLQAVTFAEALIVGDVLRVSRYDERGVPSVQLINGASVQTPVILTTKARVSHGVEFDSAGREVAYWVRGEDLKFERIPAYGPSGARVARLVRVSDQRLDGVRGMPILGVLLQQLNDLDQYRHAAVRKAKITAAFALFVKSGPGVGSRPLSGAAVRRSDVASSEGTPATQQVYSAQKYVPGITIDKLAEGEEIQAMPSTGTDDRFGVFEEALVAAMASCCNIPPEIFRQAFSSNYSASQAANIEFQSYTQIKRRDFGADFCQQDWATWLVNEALARRIEAPPREAQSAGSTGLLDVWRRKDAASRYAFQAWVAVEWAGHVKPTTDIFKLMRGLELATNMGLIDYDTAARNYGGMRFRTVVKRQRKQRRLAAEAGIPLAGTPTAEPEGAQAGGDAEDDEDEDE
jgi:lambda family phage portal protein